jgi:hypothetical protein
MSQTGKERLGKKLRGQNRSYRKADEVSWLSHKQLEMEMSLEEEEDEKNNMR